MIPPVTELSLGCAPLGNLYRAITDDDASATVDAAWESGIRYFDTAPHYGLGLSERRLGAAAALAFPLAHPAVVSVCMGACSPEQIDHNVRLRLSVVPAEVWEELRADGLLREDAPVPAYAAGATSSSQGDQTARPRLD